MKVTKLYVAGQDRKNRSWHPLGILTYDENKTYRFVYTKGSRSMKNSVFLGRMNDLRAVYESGDLFPLFRNRLLPNSRPEYSKYLQWLGIGRDEDNPLDVLAMSEGIRATDTLEVFGHPTPNSKGEYEVRFFARGLRYVSKRVLERVDILKKGERLSLAHDMQNKHDAHAMALRTDDPVEFVGYCPRYLAPDFLELLNRNNPMDTVVTVVRVNKGAPLDLRLSCKLVTPWPESFEPFSYEEFEPLVEHSHLTGPAPEADDAVISPGFLQSSPCRGVSGM